MEIREVLLDDYAAIQQLSVQLGHEYPVDEVKKNLSLIMNDEKHKVFLAIDRQTERAIGYIHVQEYKTLYSEKLLNILALVVDENWRKKGVGAALLKRADSAALEYNCAGVRVLSSAQRLKAHGFYEANGFNIIKDQKRFIKLLS